MILATIYFLLFGWLIYKHPFFKDSTLTFPFLAGILFLKVGGCFAYYWVYYHYYPGNFKSDSTSTLQDAKIMYDALPEHPIDFLRMVFGLHSNQDAGHLYETYFRYIEKWGREDITTEFFLNDNRTPIRLNAVMMLFSFGHYEVHALFMMVFSFIGQFAFYKIVKSYFFGKELLLAAVIFVAPSVLFWTSGVLKEPLAVSLMGVLIFSSFKWFLYHQHKKKYIITLSMVAIFFLILKPYILVLVSVPLGLFFLANRYHIKHVFVFYLSSLILIYGLVFMSLKWIAHKDVIQTIVVRQNDFVSLSKGGIFFINETHYIRMEYKDSTQFELADEQKKLYRIKPHSTLMYWDLHDLRDTIYITNSRDTALYNMQAFLPPAGSGLNIDRLQYSFGSFAKLIPQSFFNVLCKPFFYDSHSVTELMASLENLGIFLFFILCFSFRQKIKPDQAFLYLCVILVLLSFLLIGITTTVMGAIVRYKVPFIPFLLMIPLLYLDAERLKKVPFIKRLVK